MKEFTDAELRARQMASRLKGERMALNMTPEAAAKAGGVSRTTQYAYESAARPPDAAYLAALEVQGADVQYIITGRRERRSPQLSKAERRLVDVYASSEVEARKAIDAVLDLIELMRRPSDQN